MLPDGGPAVGAAVVLLTGDPNGAAVNPNGELTAQGAGVATDCTDEQGGFSLKPVLGMKTVAVGSSNGLVLVSLAALATNATITLPPFGALYGTLKRASAPGANETLDVAFAGGETGGLNLWLPAHPHRKPFDRSRRIELAECTRKERFAGGLGGHISRGTALDAPRERGADELRLTDATADPSAGWLHPLEPSRIRGEDRSSFSFDREALGAKLVP